MFTSIGMVNRMRHIYALQMDGHVVLQDMFGEDVKEHGITFQ